VRIGDCESPKMG